MAADRNVPDAKRFKSSPDRKVSMSEHVSHIASIQTTAKGFQAICSCGWLGVDRDSRSDDYAHTNARAEMNGHMAGIRTQRCRHCGGEIPCGC